MQRLCSAVAARQHFALPVGAGHSATFSPWMFTATSLVVPHSQCPCVVESFRQTNASQPHRNDSSQQIPCSPAFLTTDETPQLSSDPVGESLRQKQPLGEPAQGESPPPPPPTPPAPELRSPPESGGLLLLPAALSVKHPEAANAAPAIAAHTIVNGAMWRGLVTERRV
jgi:hypothetical protein